MRALAVALLLLQSHPLRCVEQRIRVDSTRGKSLHQLRGENRSASFKGLPHQKDLLAPCLAERSTTLQTTKRTEKEERRKKIASDLTKAVLVKQNADEEMSLRKLICMHENSENLCCVSEEQTSGN
jgi:hypothetical protein